MKGATTLSVTTFSSTTLSIKGLFVTLKISDNQHMPNKVLLFFWVSHFIYYYAELNIIMLSGIMLIVVILRGRYV